MHFLMFCWCPYRLRACVLWEYYRRLWWAARSRNAIFQEFHNGRRIWGMPDSWKDHQSHWLWNLTMMDSGLWRFSLLSPEDARIGYKCREIKNSKIKQNWSHSMKYQWNLDVSGRFAMRNSISKLVSGRAQRNVDFWLPLVPDLIQKAKAMRKTEIQMHPKSYNITTTMQN